MAPGPGGHQRAADDDGGAQRLARAARAGRASHGGEFRTTSVIILTGGCVSERRQGSDPSLMRQALERQVIWNRLIALVEEQAQVLLKTAFGPITREAGDLSAGVYDE